MTALSALWVPILLSAVIVFIASAIIHMVLPWHKGDYLALPNEDQIMSALRPLAIAPGDPGYSTSNINSISNNHVDSAVYVNLSASYDVKSNFTLFGTVNNLFDKDPAIAPGGNGYPTNPVYFDTYGTSFKVGARLRY